MVAKYGADACRLFVLFAAPPERDMEWDEDSVEGVVRFLARAYRFVTRSAGAGPTAGSAPGEGDRQVLRKLHQTLDRISRDFENRWHFNTSIAALMELLNVLTALEPSCSKPVLREAAVKLTLMVAPFAPYLAQELWSVELGGQGPVFKQPWPAADAELAKEEGAEVPIQVNGKLRSKIVIPFGMNKDELERTALGDAKVLPWIEGRQVVKVVIVPDKLVNIVVKG
jgi:leucyl-tRNA synthetase